MKDWEETSDPVPPPEERPKGVGTIVTVRFPTDEAAALRRLAEQEGRTHSDIIRRAVRAYAAAPPASGGTSCFVVRIDATGIMAPVHSRLRLPTAPLL
jgi:hypothetical protein